MPKYSVSIEEIESRVNTYELTIDAKSIEDANDIVNVLYENGTVEDSSGKTIELEKFFTGRKSCIDDVSIYIDDCKDEDEIE